MFNLPQFKLYILAQIDAYWTYVCEQLEANNPGWIEALKKDKDLFAEDGSPKELTKEQQEEKIKELVEKVKSVTTPVASAEIIHKFFIVDEKILERFMIKQ